MDAIYNVTPRETPFLSRLAMAPVNNFYVQWLNDTYAAAADNAWLEGIDFTDQVLSQPTRVSNITQMFYKSGKIADRDLAVLHAGMEDVMAYQEFKQLVSIKKDIELALVRGTAATGTTSTATRMNGFQTVISTNKSDISGVTLTEKVFIDFLELCYNNSDVLPTECYVGPKLKRTISLYTTKITHNRDANDKVQGFVVNTYDSDFGPVNVFFHRDLPASGTGNHDALLVDPNWFATGWLQPLRREVMPRGGKNEKFQISAELTLLYRNEASAAYIQNASYDID